MKKITLLFIMMLLLQGCSCQPTSGGGVGSLPELKRLSAKAVKESPQKTGVIRQQALQDTALTLGAQAGLADRAKQINHILEAQDKRLSAAFDFNLLLLPENVLPPVLVEGQSDLKLDTDTSIRLADRTYKILKQARFVTAPPIWRDYIWLKYTNPEVPHNSLLPKNCEEQKIWDKYVAQGWEAGQRQAETIFAENLARLKEDYQGIILYRKLLSQGMVSQPYVGRSELGVTGDSNNMRINDQVLRITALPALQENTKRWHPAAVIDKAPEPSLASQIEVCCPRG